ncbi:NAD(P)H-dependent oxidoreductase [Rhodanobacter sp. MP1X3]|uniref:flavodoxin family protein n=1 Tax=Rhodanobacter sp. MP1X3 TaxID=2723086 RepID=UPI00160B0A7D|nr:NAD(P)H-dependent oxidoreductase [Rhodanobacter sp. MP1X3]MBB6243849.1 multimeric flavodoxin WrbA [Rhodanobacter sp. MP1X3]
MDKKGSKESKSLTAFGMNCTLKQGPEESSTQKLLDQILHALTPYGVGVSHARVADYVVKPGVKADEGNGDEWPALRSKVLDANILVLASPIWMGQPSSVAKRVLERMDAFLDEIDKQGRYPTFGRVAIVAVVGNEDGAHHVTAELYQALADVGFTIPGGSSAYWVGEAMGSVNYKDLARMPPKLASTIKTPACNAAHLAALLKKSPYPAPG